MVSQQYHELRSVRPFGRHFNTGGHARQRLLRPLDAYLPFINADVCYQNARLIEEIGADGAPPPSIAYLSELIGLISLREAFDQMSHP